jgi:hypothetical protein
VIGEDAGLRIAVIWPSLVAWFSGPCAETYDETLELARTINHPFSLEYALHHTGWLCQHCRLGSKVTAAAGEQIRIASEQGFLFWHASGTLYAASGLLLQGRVEQEFG